MYFLIIRFAICRYLLITVTYIYSLFTIASYLHSFVFVSYYIADYHLLCMYPVYIIVFILYSPCVYHAFHVHYDAQFCVSHIF